MSPFLKRRLKRLAGMLGITARHVAAPWPDMASFCRHLAARGFRPGTIIDVGVADGTLDLYEPFPDARLELVEPVGEFRPAIERILSRRDGACHYVAAGSRNGGALFAIGADELIHNSRAEPGGAGRLVPMRRLDELIPDAEAPILLKVDIEGAELDVIAGAAGLLGKAEIVILETRLMDLRGGAALFHEAVAQMAARGYLVYHLFSPIARPLDRALMICDVAFVRAESALLADRRWTTDEQKARHDQRLITRIRRALAA